ncbi:MAG: hypothetical protein IPH31_05745 [Lewinellaceae bacterium]|nr:hypothetical protein [Lewinellaceae bacterium]
MAAIAVFRGFGDHFWVERLHTFCMAILTAVGISLNWRLFLKVTPLEEVSPFSNMAWLPVLFWVTSPIVFWSYQNNMLECTMTVFVLFSVYFAVKSVWKSNHWLLVMAAFLTAVAVLCKGSVGLFPVIVPFLYGITYNPKGIVGAAFRSILMLVLALTFLCTVILLVPGMREYLDYYLHKQLLPTLSGIREKQVENPFAFLLDLVSQFALPAVLLLVISAKRGFRAFSLTKPAVFFFAVGLAGTLPLVFTPKQSAHYLVPALPFFALGFAVVSSKALTWSETFSNRKAIFEKVAWFVLTVTIFLSLSFWGKYSRDAQKIQDVKAICARIGPNSIISVSKHFSNDWLLIAYFGRIGNVSLDSNQPHDLWLTDKAGVKLEGYEPLDLATTEYRLWKRK